MLLTLAVEEEHLEDLKKEKFSKERGRFGVGVGGNNQGTNIYTNICITHGHNNSVVEAWWSAK